MLSVIVVIIGASFVTASGEKTLGKADTDILNTLGGPDYVIVVIFTAAVFLILVILVKRQLLRILLISKRGAHTTIGSGAPKSLVHEIGASIRRVEKLRIEPRTLADQLQKPDTTRLHSQGQWDSGSDLENLRYRFKAIDTITYFDDLLCRVDVRFCRKSHESVRDHMKSLQNQPRTPLAGMESVCDSVVNLYEHARYGKKEFGEREFLQIASHVEELNNTLRKKMSIPGALVSNDNKRSSKEMLSSNKKSKLDSEKATAVVYRSSTTKPAEGTSV